MSRPIGVSRERTLDLAAWAAVSVGVLAWLFLVSRRLGALSMWMDEGFYYLSAREILEHGVPLYPSGHILFKGILYSYVLAFAGLVFGLNEVTLRAVSLVAAAASFPLFYAFARKFVGRTLALAGVGILLLSVWQAEYARAVLYFSPLLLVYLAGLTLFHRAYFEDRPRARVWTLVVFLLAPQVHQLAMGLWFAFPALLIVRGAKRFFRKDVLWPLGFVTLGYAAVQVHEMFFWKVGFVYEKSASSAADVLRYFFRGFSFDYFKEILKAFPRMGLLVFAGFFLFLGEAAVRRREGTEESLFLRNWYFLNLTFLFPLLFFGFFRTHVQPRYLFQLLPVCCLLFLIAVWRAADGIARLVRSAIGPPGPRGSKAAAWLAAGVCAAGIVAFADQTGWGAVRRVVTRWYKDPITTDLITRSGRFEHYDHRGVGEYVRHFRRPGDRVIAMHMVFQEIYAGGVDDWLWSGGPGTWDAWEMTKDGWRDVYVGARWISNLSDLERVLAERVGRVWLIASPSIERRDHINGEIAGFIKSNSDKLAFRGKDGMSEVYLWGDEEGTLTSGRHTAEAEWFPIPFGRVEYPAAASKNCALLFDGPAGKTASWTMPLPGTLKPGRYRLVVSARTEGPAAEGAALGLILRTAEGKELRSAVLGADGSYREWSWPFFLGAEGGLSLEVRTKAGAAVSWDYLDIKPAD